MNIVLVPGLNNRFDSVFLKTAKAWADQRGAAVIEHPFRGDMSDYTFEAQASELRSRAAQNTLFVAKSLGCIPTLLLDAPCVLFGPPIDPAREEARILQVPFRDMATEPVPLGQRVLMRRETHCTLLYNLRDAKLDTKALQALRPSEQLRIIALDREGHDLAEQDVPIAREALDHAAARL